MSHALGAGAGGARAELHADVAKPGRRTGLRNRRPSAVGVRLPPSAPSRRTLAPGPKAHRRSRPGGAPESLMNLERSEMDSAEMVERGTILRATVGSTVHGLHHGGQDDRDEMAVFVEPPEYLLGLARARGIKRRPLRVRALRRADAAGGCPIGPGRPRPRRVQPAQVRAARAQGTSDDPAAPVRAGRAHRYEDDPRRRAARRSHRRSSRGGPAAGTSAICAARRSACSARAARSASTGPSSSRRTATTRSTRCTPRASATRASSCSRRAG